MLPPPFIEGSWQVAPAYVDAAHVAQLALLLLVCAWRLRAVLRNVPTRRHQTVPSHAQLLLQEDVRMIEPQATALSSCATALRGVHVLCCSLLLVGSVALLAIGDRNGNPQCLGLCVGLRVADIGQWLLCLLLVLAEWRAGRRAGRGLRAWWLLSSLVALADALAALADLRQEAATAAATVELASLVPSLLLGMAGLCEGDTPRAPAEPPDAPCAPRPSPPAERPADAPRPPAEARASAFSRLTLSWVTPLLVRGRRNALELADLPGLAPADTTRANAARLSVQVAAQRRRRGAGSLRRPHPHPHPHPNPSPNPHSHRHPNPDLNPHPNQAPSAARAWPPSAGCGAGWGCGCSLAWA